jgi:predicted DNA-binding transcriptional regulator AlpA
MVDANIPTDNSVISFTSNIQNDIKQVSNSLHAKYLPPQGMSRASQLLPFLPFGSSTLWAWSRDGRFPSPIRLSSTMTAWRNADVIEWLSNRNISIIEEV